MIDFVERVWKSPKAMMLESDFFDLYKQVLEDKRGQETSKNHEKLEEKIDQKNEMIEKAKSREADLLKRTRGLDESLQKSNDKIFEIRNKTISLEEEKNFFMNVSQTNKNERSE